MRCSIISNLSDLVVKLEFILQLHDAPVVKEPFLPHPIQRWTWVLSFDIHPPLCTFSMAEVPPPVDPTEDTCLQPSVQPWSTRPTSNPCKPIWYAVPVPHPFLAHKIHCRPPWPCTLQRPRRPKCPIPISLSSILAVKLNLRKLRRKRLINSPSVLMWSPVPWKMRTAVHGRVWRP